MSSVAPGRDGKLSIEEATGTSSQDSGDLAAFNGSNGLSILPSVAPSTKKKGHEGYDALDADNYPYDSISGLGAMPCNMAPPVEETSFPPDKSRISRKRVFGLNRTLESDKNRPHSTHHFSRFDYEQKYPRDLFGEERGENARVWLTYLDEVEPYDRDKIEGWKDTIDVLLVFAGLFSAIVSTFAVQTSQNLQPNFTQISAILLFELAQLQRAQITGVPIVDIPTFSSNPNSPFTPPTNMLLVNGLWFSSLTISICTALFAVLTKQWLYYYLTPVPGAARQKVRTRQFLFEGLETWRVALIIDLLPILLHLALGLFLTGLIIFIFPLDIRISWIIITISGSTYILYLVSVMLPVWYPQCLYTTPLTIYAGSSVQMLRAVRFRLSLLCNRVTLKGSSIYRQKLLAKPFLRLLRSLAIITSAWVGTIRNIIKNILSTFYKMIFGSTLYISKNWREVQLKESIAATPYLDDKAIHWLYSMSSNQSVIRILARSAFVSTPADSKTGLSFERRGPMFWNSRYDDLWSEDSLRLILNETDFFEDLCYGLYTDFKLMLQEYRYTRIVRFIFNGPASVQRSIQTYYPELFNLITILSSNDYVKILLRGFQEDTFKTRIFVWCYLLNRAQENKELASCIISSRRFPLFSWHDIPSNVQRSGMVSLGGTAIEELGEGGFQYLFRFFFKHRAKEFSLDIRYLLFVAIYQNLVSKDPLIIDPGPRQDALGRLFRSFYDLLYIEHKCIRGNVITKRFLKRFQNDILFTDHLLDSGTPSFVRRGAMACFERLWERRTRRTGDVSHVFSIEKEELRFIYRWLSKYKYSIFVHQLFVPENFSNLHQVLLDDPAAKSNIRNCLRQVPSFESSRHSSALDSTGVVPNILRFFTTTPPAQLLAVLYDPPVVVEAWEKFLLYSVVLPVDGYKTFLTTIRTCTKVDSESLKKIFDLMIEKSLERLTQQWVYTFAKSAYIFGRTASVIVDPAELDSTIPTELVRRLGFESVTFMRENFERQFREEKRKEARFLSCQFARMKQTFSKIWRHEHGYELERGVV